MDQLEDQVGYSKSLMNSKFKTVIRALISNFKPRFLDEIPPAILETSLKTFASRGFTGCLGSVDCTHIYWKCPKIFQSVFKGKEGHTTIAVQAVATPDLYCLSFFARSPGTNNDKSVLQMDPYFHKILNGDTSCVNGPFQIGNATSPFRFNYFLADGIYPRWAIFMSPLPVVTTHADKKMNERIESYRKDVERFFGVLKQRFKIIRTGNRIEFREKEFVTEIATVCAILHNMIHDYCSRNIDTTDGDTDILCEFSNSDVDDDDDAGTPLSTVEYTTARILQCTSAVISEAEHSRLRAALRESFSSQRAL